MQADDSNILKADSKQLTRLKSTGYHIIPGLLKLSYRLTSFEMLREQQKDRQ